METGEEIWPTFSYGDSREVGHRTGGEMVTLLWRRRGEMVHSYGDRIGDMVTLAIETRGEMDDGHISYGDRRGEMVTLAMETGEERWSH